MSSVSKLIQPQVMSSVSIVFGRTNMVTGSQTLVNRLINDRCPLHLTSGAISQDVYILGAANVGKSSLVNRLISRDVFADPDGRAPKVFFSSFLLPSLELSDVNVYEP